MYSPQYNNKRIQGYLLINLVMMLRKMFYLHKKQFYNNINRKTNTHIMYARRKLVRLVLCVIYNKQV